MPIRDEVLFCVQDVYAQSFIEGKKTIELRRRAPNISSETRVWVYSKLPIGAVRLTANVTEIRTMETGDIWEKYKSDIDLTEGAFRSYFSGVSTGAAIFLNNIKKIEHPIYLHDIRQIVPGFHPPQFFRWIRNGSAELSLFRTRIGE